jgi:class 3 adenylate cyclase
MTSPGDHALAAFAILAPISVDCSPHQQKGLVAVFDGAERAIHAAQEIGQAPSGIGLEVRAAVHTDEIELEGGNVRGAAMHIAARIADLAEPGQVYASWATRELLVGSPIGFTDRSRPARAEGTVGRAPRLPGRAVRLSNRMNPVGGASRLPQFDQVYGASSSSLIRPFKARPLIVARLK